MLERRCLLSYISAHAHTHTYMLLALGVRWRDVDWFVVGKVGKVGLLESRARACIVFMTVLQVGFTHFLPPALISLPPFSFSFSYKEHGGKGSVDVELLTSCCGTSTSTCKGWTCRQSGYVVLMDCCLVD